MYVHFWGTFIPHLISHMCGVKTQADVHLEIIEMEKTMLLPGGTFDKTSATSLIMAAFDIEDAQYVPYHHG